MTSGPAMKKNKTKGMRAGGKIMPGTGPRPVMPTGPSILKLKNQ